MVDLMNRSLGLEGTFKLLVRVTDPLPPDAFFVELCGNPWVLAEFAQISDAPPYTCISYSWGTGRTQNIFEDGQLMSDRTMPAIEATIRTSLSPELWANALTCISRDPLKVATAVANALESSQAIWIDALCVPSRNPARAACLRSMGAIYRSATQVVAVLPKSCSQLLHKIQNGYPMTLEELLTLEADDWITRAWTYQETANSKFTLYVAEGDVSVLVHEHDFLSAIVTATTDYADTQKFSRTELSVQFPRLDSLQEMIAEHKIEEFTGRSAYQVMSAMHQRYAEREEDRVYAMIGVVTDVRTDSFDDASLDPTEYFMRICEAKGDFSFIYSAAQRSDAPGRLWRPAFSQIPPVISGLLAYGTGQSGSLKASHLQLDNVCRVSQGKTNPEAMKSIGWFLQRDIKSSSSSEAADAVLKRLRQKGFLGCGEHLELENGYFFLQSGGTRSDEAFVVVTEGVQWTNGGPGLLVCSDGSDIYRFCDVGVFVGRMPKVSETIKLG